MPILNFPARDLAINGHSQPRFHDGKPVWKFDPKIAADALTMNDLEWGTTYGDRLAHRHVHAGQTRSCTRSRSGRSGRTVSSASY